jgi:ABC-type sugar transport system ATPase subunit
VNAMAVAPLVLELSGIRKSYGATQALRGLSVTIRGGEVFGIAGPNGAGKTTLVRVLAGEDGRDGGEIRLNGHAWEPGDPGGRVAVVHQEPLLWGNLSVAENLLVGRERFILGRPRLSRDEHEILRELEIAAHADRPLAGCSLAVRQRAEIARALAQDARILLFDEPNSALTEQESDRLFAYMHDLAREGRIVILISHRLAELVAHCRRVAIIRDGLVVAELSGPDLTEEAIARELVIGASIGPESRQPAVSGQGSTATGIGIDEPALALENWSGIRGALSDVHLEVWPGEVVAVVGVEGSGARELVKSAAGHAPGVGHRVVAGAGDERAPVYLPADRREALFGNLSVGQNLVIRLGAPEIASSGGLLRLGRLRALAAQLVARFGIRTRAPDAPIGSLSGGNQQKVAIAAAIARKPTLLVLEEPTRGVDVGAKRDIYRIVRQFADDGGGVLVYCTEVPEVFELADRVVILDAGRVTQVLRVADYDGVAALAAAIAAAEHTEVTHEDLVASHARVGQVDDGRTTGRGLNTAGGLT